MKSTNNFQTSNREMVTISRAEYEELQAQSKRVSELESHVDLLMEALRLARHKQFGASSEKTDESFMEQLSFLFNEAEVFSTTEKEEPEATDVVGHKRHKKHAYTLDTIPEGIPTKQVEHRLEGEDLVCPQCRDTMTEIGKEVVKTLEIVPAQYIVREDIYYTYACLNCNRENIETPVVKAPREKNIILGSFATPEAIAYIMTQKFVMGCPLYRQEQEINRQGIQLSRQTMSNWILRATEDYLVPVYQRLHEELLKREVLHADETTLQVLHEPGKKPESKSFMWLYRTSGDADKPIVLYEYQPGRGAKHPKEFLAGYKGYLHTDGYAGYHDLGEDITVVGCWAHARRKFDKTVKSLPKGKAKGSSASQGLAYFNLLFEIEQGLAEKTAEERYNQRLKQEKPVLDAMWSWVNSRTAAPQSALGKAFTYLKEQWPYLTNYLKDGRLELSNNRAERSIKPFVIDRKNFLFANTPKGAAGSAVMFSLIQTAIENGLDPYRYLPSVDKGQYGFLGHLRRLAALSSLPGDSPAASSALPATKSAPEKLRRTCQRDKTGAGKEEDEGGLVPTEDDDAASVDFSRWQACRPLSTEGILSSSYHTQHRSDRHCGSHCVAARERPDGMQIFCF